MKKSRIKKFQKGGVVRSLRGIVDAYENNRYLFLNGVPKHPAWLFNMQLRTVFFFLSRRALRYAQRNPKYPYTFDAFRDSTGLFATCPEFPGVILQAEQEDALIASAQQWANEKTGVATNIRLKYAA